MTVRNIIGKVLVLLFCCRRCFCIDDEGDDDDDVSFSFKSSLSNHFWGRTSSFYKQTHYERDVVGDTWVFVSENYYESIEKEVMIDDNDNGGVQLVGVDFCWEEVLTVAAYTILLDRAGLFARCFSRKECRNIVCGCFFVRTLIDIIGWWWWLVAGPAGYVVVFFEEQKRKA